jgi:SAM-dependent methyltransferase
VAAGVSACVLCGAPDVVTTITRDRLPTMQNYVHRTREHALRALEGAFDLAVCRSCGFAWNTAFDPSRLLYDDSYDNAVPSSVMDRYYEELAEYLGHEYDLADGYVVDVGCGNGRFLKALARVWPGCRGLGVDPALPGDELHADGRIHLVKGVFGASRLDAPPSLFVCRHVLEHIPDPAAFVRDLRGAIGGRPDVPLFVEVPDLDWIVQNRAFWDFCYEHCNYFSENSLRAVFTRGGFDPVRSRVGFGSQYRWMEGLTLNGATTSHAAVTDPQRAGRLSAYAEQERDEIHAVQRRLTELKSRGAVIAIWGMATKGIMYSLLVDPDSTLIDIAVDVNGNKQGCFVPTTGRPIEAPSALQRARGGRVAVVVMNLNYLQEIRAACDALGVAAQFLDAAGREAAA